MSHENYARLCKINCSFPNFPAIFINARPPKRVPIIGKPSTPMAPITFPTVLTTYETTAPPTDQTTSSAITEPTTVTAEPTTTQILLTTTPPGKPCNDSWNVAPDPNDCEGYFACVDGRITHMFCPVGHHFDKEKEVLFKMQA